MKIIIKSIVCLMVVFTIGIGIAAYANEKIEVTDSTIMLNFQKVEFSTPTITYNDRTMVPMRELFEKLGAKVEWEETTQKITASTNTKKIIMHINNNEVIANDLKMPIDAPPILYNERTMVPLRFVSEQLSLNVNWNADTNTISLLTMGDVTIGETRWNDDLTYVGEIVNKLEHGIGVLKNKKTGKIAFRGNFQFGYRQGYGVSYWDNGNISSIGYYEDDQYNGSGKDYREDGTLLYEGGHWNSTWTSQGTLYWPNGKVKYTGTWSDNNAHGYGKSYWEDGTLAYDGQWNMGKRSGFGTGNSRYPNGVLLYEGTYRDGLFDGVGKEYYENGVLRYEGEFRKGGWDGFGKLYRPDGTLDYEGRFYFDEKTGISTWYRNR